MEVRGYHLFAYLDYSPEASSGRVLDYEPDGADRQLAGHNRLERMAARGESLEMSAQRAVAAAGMRCSKEQEEGAELNLD